jgi:hypothetical protein
LPVEGLDLFLAVVRFLTRLLLLTFLLLQARLFLFRIQGAGLGIDLSEKPGGRAPIVA